MCEKEMIRYLLESGAEVKALFWNEIPGFKPLNKYEDEGKKVMKNTKKKFQQKYTDLRLRFFLHMRIMRFYRVGSL